ncbi:cell division cycle-associated protein 3 [Megalops cyprinoides]|uniref:cell division cycle-associated protein 3 n=1 Tax=Megalops cyprinoides TaxID=118141 RepID=UPI00186441A4|nr:cell division cycle-associated protein 3 [Megalops cyprinoides]
MGISESKFAVATPRPERSGQIRNERICRLVDPRSPSAGIDRTPIQVGEFATRGAVRVESEGPVSAIDPRSPTPGVSRTPMKDVMRATVSSFARRLGLAFLNEEGDSNDPLPPLTFSKLQNLNLDEDGEMDSAEPLLPPNPPLFAAVSPDVCTPGASVCDSPSLSTQDSGFSAEEEEEQGQVDVEAKQFLDVGDMTADGESTLNKELSLSLLTCHDGVASSQMLSDDGSRPPSPLPDIDPLKDVDSEACLSPTPDPDQPLTLDAATTPSLVSSDITEPPSNKSETPVQPETSIEESPKPTTDYPSPTHIQSQSGSEPIRVKHFTFNTQSPSQVVFKPQWLGVGFGVTGVRARGVQGKAKGGSSPLSVRGGGKNAGNENRGQVARQKQRERCGKALVNEVRSPLQILKETNSPRDHASQLKLKIATPERQRLEQTDRRALSLCLDKENQR